MRVKGIIFTAFIEMVENTFSPEMADDIILASDLPSGGSYSGVGTYDHAEIIQLVSQLSQRTNMPIPDLVRAFGNYLFDDFTVRFSQFINEHESAFDFLKSVHSYIHIEVRKLYPEADFPLLTYEEPSANVLEIHYHSTRPFADLAEGMIAGCIAHFQENIEMVREDSTAEQGQSAKFTLTNVSA